MRDDFYHLVPDEVVLRGLGQRRELRCYCCGTRYRRGEFRCCAPPNGMRSEVWLQAFCPPEKLGGCGKCPHHCLCANRLERLGHGPMKHLCDEFMGGLLK